jgi:hypothetical protein
MTYEDFYINCKPDLSAIAQALSCAFDTHPEDIEVSQDAKEFSFKKQLRCEITEYGGEFSWRLGLVSIDHSVLEVDIFEKIGFFCELIGCLGFSFGPEQNTNPYTGLIIYKRKRYQQVLLNANLLVHRKEIVRKMLGKAFSDLRDWDDSAFQPNVDES